MSGQHVILRRFRFHPKRLFGTLWVKRLCGQEFRTSDVCVGRWHGAELTQFPQPVRDMILNAGEQLKVLLKSGDVMRVDSDGEHLANGFAPIGSTRLMSLDDGSVLALAGRRRSIAVVYVANRGAERPEQFEVVPLFCGNQSVGFDSLGNLCLRS